MLKFAQLIRTFRPTILVVLGALIGAGVAPVMAGTHPEAQIATTQTRAASCSGLNFHPVDSATGYTYKVTELYWTGGGSGFFLCDPNLPNGAVVKQVQVTLHDSVLAGEVHLCGLFRSGLAASSATTYQAIASLPSSDTQPGGDMRLSTSSISNATVDNAHYAYWLQCQLTDATEWLGIYGADVIYTISAANG